MSVSAYLPWIIVGGLLLAGGILGIVVYRRSRAPQRSEYLKGYIDHVMSACLQAGVPDPSIAAIVKKYEDPATKDTITWGELFTVESHLMARQPEPVLRRRAWSLRDRFREVVGQRQYENYLLSLPPNENDLAPSELPLLRADLERLLDALHWSYALIPVRERLRTQIISAVSAQIFVWTLVVAGLVVWSASYKQTLLATLVLVLLAGALGGFVSLLRRIQMVPVGGDPLLSIFELENGRVSLYLAPLSGALFALVLFFVFQGGLLKGALFPELTGFSLKIYEFSWANDPIAHVEYAKLLVWAFIAGFAERLVPDTLARLVQRGEEASAAARTAPPPGPPAVPAPSRALPSPPSAGQTGFGASPPPSPPVRTRISSPPFR
jgi:hypothetical protein